MPHDITRRTLSADEVAARFGYARSWIYRNLKRLTDEDGFPRPVTSIGHLRWDAGSVDAWFNRHNPENDRDTPPASALVDHYTRSV